MSLDDRLSFGGGPLGGLPPEAEPEEEQPAEAPKSNRLFVFLAIAMGGLILLGVLALVAAFVWVVPQQRQARLTALTQTVEAITAEAESWTPTPEPTATEMMPTWTPTLLPTETPIPTATATRVVQDTGEQPTSTPTPTRSALDDWGSTTPSAGLGSFGVMAVAVGLAGLVFAARKLRGSH